MYLCSVKASQRAHTSSSRSLFYLLQFVPGDADDEGHEDDYPIVGTRGGDDGSDDGTTMEILHRQDFVLDEALYSVFNS